MNYFDNFKIILDNLWEGAYILNKERKIVYWNKAAENITGFKVDEVINKSCSYNILRHIDEKGNELCKKTCPVSLILDGSKKIEANVFLHHKMGYRIPVKIVALRIIENSGEIYGLELFYPIIDHNKILENDILKSAFVDKVTEALNRNGLETFFYTRYKEMTALKKVTGVIFSDIDDFKKINDSYGHEIGDRILYNFSKTIRKTLRHYDIHCRWGGEEFVTIVFLDNPEIIKILGERFKILIENNFFETDGKIIKYTASFGATLLKSEENLYDAINRADSLMYLSKQKGKNRIEYDLR